MRTFIREIIETIIMALLLFLGVQFGVQSFEVQGTSMHPTLTQGQYLLVNKIVYRNITFGGDAVQRNPESLDYQSGRFFPFHAPEAGEVVVFNFPNDPTRDFIKRVIGTPGDTVEIRRGHVFVNGVQLHEPYIMRTDTDDMEPFPVPPDSFFVLGDNRRDSNDSRDWGAVPLDNMVGRAWVRYWPITEIGVFPGADMPTSTSAQAAQ